jgi:apolipoprotein D and lipocalin family protein
MKYSISILITERINFIFANRKKIMKKILLIISSIMLFGSVHSQKAPSVVSEVDLKRYQGFWYEIARLPNYFERKLKCTSATYTLRDDGKITVLNQGHYISDPQKTSSITGVAWIPDKNAPAKLKVQFFWPFSGNYWILDLDSNYKWVLVGDPSMKYLWILAREKKMDDKIYTMLLQKAIDNGYDITSIIKVEQDCN